MDSTITLAPTYINAGIWAKKNKIIFQIKDDMSKEIIMSHQYAGFHPHAMVVKEVCLKLAVDQHT